MRTIIFINPHSDPLALSGEPDAGGQCVYELELMKALAALADDIAVVSFTRGWGGKAREVAVAERATVVRIEAGGDGFIRKEELEPLLPAFAGSAKAWLARRDLSPYVVHGHYWDGGSVGMKLAGDGVPFVWTAHSLGKIKQMNLPDEALYRYSVRIPEEERIVTAANLIISTSAQEEGLLEEYYPSSRGKISVVPAGVDTVRYRPSDGKAVCKKKLGVNADHLVFTVGRVDERKGYDLLIEMIPRVLATLAKKGKQALFAIPVGAGSSPYARELVKMAEERRLSGRIRFFPRLTDEELMDHYNASDLFVCPSRYEPFGIVIVEALACGIPVVATDRGGPREILAAETCGYARDPEDIGAFADTIAALLLDDGLRMRMGAAAREKAVREYSWRAIAGQILAAYERAAGDKQ